MGQRSDRKTKHVGWKHLSYRTAYYGTGLAALLWFLIRVIPKPSRAAYPCQRAALPRASAFVIWLTSGLITVSAFKRASAYAKRHRPRRAS